MTSFTLLLNDLFKVNKNIWVKIIKSETTYSESESDFRFAINLVLDFDSASEYNSESDSDFTSVFMNLDILFYICIRLNKPADGFFYPFSWQSQ